MPFDVGPVELLVILVTPLALVAAIVLIIRALITRRACPVCGSPVKRGRSTCATCRHDFAAAHHA